MKLNQKLLYVVIGALLLGFGQVGFYLTQQHTLAASYEAHEQEHEAEVQQEKIKIIHLINYPLGGKTKYLEWVKEVGPSLVQAEVQRIRSYDNFDGGNPHRLVEMEFDSIEDMQKFQRRSEIRSILDDLSNHTSSSHTHTFVQRSDYLKLSP
ncbi:hypothetical protein CMK10_03640 [Candidatus Poribacteria bacterium]|jgi:hypothetical protein|nr:hypothetical protein [Candidatus Poribacteria bacterium]|tara:strand:- start:241 stop:696 length:456 start_codon:yes stop_codon:yes gene_type:complete